MNGADRDPARIEAGIETGIETGSEAGTEIVPERDPERERVAAVLAGLSAGVRQRRAELATLGDAADGTRPALAELRAREVLQEPVAASPRPLVGRLLAFGRKAFFHLFGKWYARPLLMQQNEHNRAVSRLLEDLVAGQERLGAEVARLGRRMDRLEEAEAAPARTAGATGTAAQPARGAGGVEPPPGGNR